MRRHLGLRARLSAVVAVGATLVMTFAALALYTDLSGEVSDTITGELQVRIADLHSELDDPSSALSAPRPVVAQVVDLNGVVVYPEGAIPLLTKAELERARVGRLVLDRPVPSIGDDARLLAREIDTTGHGRVIAVAATSTSPLAHVRHRLLLLLLLGGPALIAAVTLMGWTLAGAALQPVQRMARRASTISMSEPGERLPQPPGGDEIAELGAMLNAMLARIEATIAHERAFIDDASHELRAPLAVLRGELELAATEDDATAVNEGLRSALEEADRLGRLTESLLTLARADAGQVRAGAASIDVLDRARVAAARFDPPPGVTIRVAGVPASVAIEPEWMDQIVGNLVANALRHARTAVDVEVSAAHTEVRIAVSDDGPGFSPALLPQAFDRFTRGDSTRGRGGTGLGLAIVATITRALGGEVGATNGLPLGGARVEVTLPVGRG